MGNRVDIDGPVELSSKQGDANVPVRTCEPEEIARALSAILRSATFRASPLLRRLIGFLVRRSQEGEASGLTATTIAREALGKGPEFRSHKDASVRVAINRLRTTLRLYYANEGANDDIVIALEPGSNRPAFRRRLETSTPDSVERALQFARSYQSILSPVANSSTLHALQKELRSQPDHPSLLAAYADLCLDTYKYSFGTMQNPLDEAIRAIGRAATPAPPNDPAILFVQASLALAQDHLDRAAEVGQTMIQAEPEDIESRLMGEWIMAHTVSPTLAWKSASIRADEHASATPWLHLTAFLAAYQERRYEAALESAVNIGLPHFFWGPMLRAAALAQVGLKYAAKKQIERAVALNADLAEAPRCYLRHHIKDKETLLHVLEGLYEAGLGR